MDPESDPSQFSCQVSEYALVSALNALRFSQVVLMVIQGIVALEHVHCCCYHSVFKYTTAYML